MSRWTIFRLVELSIFLLWSCCRRRRTIDARVEVDKGVVRVKSTVPMAEAIVRVGTISPPRAWSFLPEDRPVKSFTADAGVNCEPRLCSLQQPATGHPVHYVEFRLPSSNWRVGLLLNHDNNGGVWTIWTDFDSIARRHNGHDRSRAFRDGDISPSARSLQQ